jgi:hypothetical protein
LSRLRTNPKTSALPSQTFYTMGKIVKYLLVLWLVGVTFAVIFRLFERENRSILFGAGFVFVVIILFFVKEKLRQKKEGYHVYKRGGADDGIVVYDEGGKTLSLYFNRKEDTIYVPSDTKWKELMPEWAKERKTLIMHRVRLRLGKRLIGKNWTYEESDNQDYLIEQN